MATRSKPKTTATTATEQTAEASTPVDDSTQVDISEQPKDEPKEKEYKETVDDSTPVDESTPPVVLDTPPVEVVYSEILKQKLEFYKGYDGILKPILVAHGTFEYVPFDYSRSAKEQVLEQVEKYKGAVFLDGEALIAHLKRLHSLYYGSTPDTVPEEFITTHVNNFYELVYNRMFNGMYMTIDVYDNTLTFDIKYNFNFV